MSTRTAAVLAGAGAALIVAGVAVIFWPAGLVCAGGLMFATGLAADTRG